MVNFVLSSLNSSVAMSLGATIEDSTIPTLDVSAVALFEVAVDTMKNVFKFQTDSNDFSDLASTDIKYYVHSASWPSLNPANGMMDATDSSGSIATSDYNGTYAQNKMLVAHDFLRYIALKLFNTHHGVDLFNNEIDLLKNLRSICGSTAAGNTWYDVAAAVGLVGVSGSHGDLAGVDGSKYMTNSNDTDANLCRVLLEQMTKNAITRFASIGNSDSPQSLPFEVNDSISFKLIIAAAPDQESLTGVAAIPSRSYEIRMKLVASASNTTVDAAETA